MLLMIDNYDSFTYNLVQYLQMLKQEVKVVRNDELSLEETMAIPAEAVIISPGPCTPHEAGISVPLIQSLSGKRPILGICLGHQSIAAAFGGNVIHAKAIMHGKTSNITHDNTGIFAGLPCPFAAVRYHSLAVEAESLPGCLRANASTEDGEIMGLQHTEHLTVGVQFHPESILTSNGMDLLANFLKMAGLDIRN